jgi:hypothetical protein
MTAVQAMTDEQFEQQILSVVEREFGLDGLARFLRLNRSGSGDYTKDRHTWLGDKTVADIMKDMK